MKRPLVSIIIPLRRVNAYLRENIAACQKNSYTDFEIIVLVDEPTHEKFPQTTILVTGRLGPAEKRDLGARKAKGTVLCFLDDDAYPHTEWLAHVVRHFTDATVAGVGGPGVTPPGVGWLEQASGWASASPAGSGKFMYRFLPVGDVIEVDDYPSMNLAVRAADFAAVGGFDSSYWPGEDTKLCHDLTHKLKKRILYDPGALVYHHRRPLWKPHLRQQGNFGLHRGYFARVLPKTSARAIYFLPSGLLLATAALLIQLGMAARGREFSGVEQGIWAILAVALLSYSAIVVSNAFWIFQQSRNPVQGLISIPAIILTHYWYGIRFLQGFLFTKRLTT